MVRLAYEERGRGAPVLLIMGYSSRSAHWGDEFRNLLASTYRVVSFDNRGTGESDKPADEWTMLDMADDAIAVMDAAAMPSAHVIGLSMGGMIAQELALAYQDGLLTLTLIATHSGGPNVVPPTQNAANAILNPDRNQPAEKLLENIWRSICAPGFMDTPGRLEAFLKLDLDKPTPVAMLANQMKAVEGSDHFHRLPMITAPTIIITGTSDPLVPEGNSERLAALIPGSKLVHIADCGHMIPLEKPRELASSILEFIAEHP
jgi:pimeloyl-ACP methyl ester carboxylesterase